VSRCKRKPLVLTYHNDIVGEGFAKYIAKIYNKTALKMLLDSTDGIIVTRSSHMSPYLKDHAEKSFIIPVGIDIDVFRPQEVPMKGDIFFLSVLDEYHRYKGLEVLLGAMKILKQEIPDVKLIVGGCGDLVDFYIRVADSLGLKNNVKFAGFISAKQLLNYYNGCKLFVLPSTDPRREGFGIVPLEAMACQRPVVITEIMGMAEDIKKSGSGMVVGCNDKEGLASSMLCILKDETLAKRMGTLGRKLTEEKYSWKKVAEQIEKVYRGLV
jgi:glycosyltransferase involved in cell wall biosynthesis